MALLGMRVYLQKVSSLGMFVFPAVVSVKLRCYLAQERILLTLEVCELKRRRLH